MNRDQITATLIASARSQNPEAFLNVRASDLLVALDPEFVPHVIDEPANSNDLRAAAGV